MSSTFCPNCGTLRLGSFRFCRSCQFDFDTVPVTQPHGPPSNVQSSATPGVTSTTAATHQGIDATDVFLWVGSIASLAGLVWLWLNTNTENVVLKLTIVGALEFMGGIVFTVLAFAVLLLGMIGFVVKPFWRR